MESLDIKEKQIREQGRHYANGQTGVVVLNIYFEKHYPATVPFTTLYRSGLCLFHSLRTLDIYA